MLKNNMCEWKWAKDKKGIERASVRVETQFSLLFNFEKKLLYTLDDIKRSVKLFLRVTQNKEVEKKNFAKMSVMYCEERNNSRYTIIMLIIIIMLFQIIWIFEKFFLSFRDLLKFSVVYSHGFDFLLFIFVVKHGVGCGYLRLCTQ